MIWILKESIYEDYQNHFRWRCQQSEIRGTRNSISLRISHNSFFLFLSRHRHNNVVSEILFPFSPLPCSRVSLPCALGPVVVLLILMKNAGLIGSFDPTNLGWDFLLQWSRLLSLNQKVSFCCPKSMDKTAAFYESIRSWQRLQRLSLQYSDSSRASVRMAHGSIRAWTHSALPEHTMIMSTYEEVVMINQAGAQLTQETTWPMCLRARWCTPLGDYDDDDSDVVSINQ
jgi:hypothetical protein